MSSSNCSKSTDPPPIQPRLWQIYYRDLKNIFQRKHRFLWNKFLIVTYVFEVARLLLATYCLVSGNVAWFEHDIFLHMINRNNLYDRYIFLAIIGLPLCAAYFNYEIYCKSSRVELTRKPSASLYEFTWQMIYDLTMRNTEQLFQLEAKITNKSNRKNKKESTPLHELLNSISGAHNFFRPDRIVTFWRIYSDIWRNGPGVSNQEDNENNNKVGSRKQNYKLSKYKLKHFPMISMKLRARIFLVIVSSELFHAWMLSVIWIIIILGIGYYLNILYEPNEARLIDILPAILEMAIIGFEVWNCSKMLLMLTFILRVVVFVHFCLFRELRTFLRNTFSNISKESVQLKSICEITHSGLLIKLKRSGNSRIRLTLTDEAKLNFRLNRFRREHTRLVRHITHADASFFSTIIVVFIVCNIPFNVYFIAFVYRNAQKVQVDTFVVLFALFSYIIATLIASGSVSYLSEQVHQYEPEIFSFQTYLGLNSLRLKLKLMSSYELINSNEKISFTVGALGPITKFAVLKFIFFYLGYIMFSLQFIYSNHQQAV